jgi:hypothetical protein
MTNGIRGYVYIGFRVLGGHKMLGVSYKRGNWVLMIEWGNDSFMCICGNRNNKRRLQFPPPPVFLQSKLESWV